MARGPLQGQGSRLVLPVKDIDFAVRRIESPTIVLHRSNTGSNFADSMKLHSPFCFSPHFNDAVDIGPI